VDYATKDRDEGKEKAKEQKSKNKAHNQGNEEVVEKAHVREGMENSK
jgi:hypothetical protein